MESPNGGILDSNDIKSVLRIVSKNWWIMVSFVSVFFIAGYIYAYKQPDIYAAKTQLLLQTNDTYYARSVISSSSEGYGYQQYISNSNEISIIKSYDLIKKVVDKLNIGVSFYIRGRLRTTEVYSGVPFSVTVFSINPMFYEKEIDFKILDLYHYQISYSEGKNKFTQSGTFGSDFVNTDMRINVTTSKGINQNYVNTLKDIDYQFIIHNPIHLVYQFQQGITATNVTMSSVVEVSLKDMIPMRAIAFLDTLDALYIQNTLTSQFDLNANTIKYIDIELAQVTDALNSIEDTMQAYKETRKILDLGKEEEQYFNQYNTLEGETTNVKLEIDALNDLEKYIYDDGKEHTFLPPSIYINSTDEFLKKCATELYSLQLSKNEALSSSTSINPSLKNLDKRIDSLRENLLTYINNSRKAFNAKIIDLDNSTQNYIQKIKTIPGKMRGLSNIERREDVNVKLYEFLLEKRATTTIEKAAIIPETKVIETARSLGVVEPNRNKIYYTFVAIGAVIALLIIFIRITLYDRIENIQELKLKTNLPILGEILSAPLVNDLSIAVEDNPKSPLTESFRTLRTNLQYMAIDTSSKLLLFTSNGPGEGKTFCSINMAAILAKAEKKVLLLEFDLHKPRINKALNLFSDKGLSTIIIGKSTIEECIIHTPIAGMDVILCGPIPPNSSELILSEKVNEIFKFSKEHYDYVIVDTPPLGLISDAFILMRMSDINLFVLNTRFAYKDAISYVQETVQVNKIKNFGFVLNNVKRKKSKYYYNRYNYGYYGGYGYGGYGSYGT